MFGDCTRGICSSTALRYLGLALLVLGLAVAQPTPVYAQAGHGVSIFKQCVSPRTTCTSDDQCPGSDECTVGACTTPPGGNLTDCQISIAHADIFGDTTQVLAAFDIIDPLGAATRVPAVGDLPITLVSGNAICTAGPTLPCLIGPAGSVGTDGVLILPGAPQAGIVTFRSNQYVIQPIDPNPLNDQANVDVKDLCDVVPNGCSNSVNRVQFTASTAHSTGCEIRNKEDSTPCGTRSDCAADGCEGGVCVPNHVLVPDSTPCTDDGNLCTTAGCDGAGNCDQNHILKVCTTDECNTGQCNPTTGLCVPVPPSTPCTERDGNECTTAGCEATGELGSCVQTHIFVPDSSPCAEADGVECTTAGCDGAGLCDQKHLSDCAVLTCRTPGFWGTHARANPAKPRSQNITQAVIKAGGGSLEICGECINATVPIDNAASAVEALCVSPRGDITLQNARQLTALALNCIISGLGADCSGDTDLGSLFSDCNNACEGVASTRTNAQCRAEIDCINNGGDFNEATGFCQLGTCASGQACGVQNSTQVTCADGSTCTPLPGNCHDRDLVNESLGLDFEPPGPAGSERDCNAAIGNKCTVIGPGEDECSTDTCED